MKPILALLGFMLSTVALFLQPTPNPDNNLPTAPSTVIESPSFLESFDQPVEHFEEPCVKEIL